MNTLRKQLVKEIISDGEFAKSGDISSYLRDIFKDILQEMLEKEASSALDKIDEKWGKQYPSAIKIWRNNCDAIAPFFSFPKEIRTIYNC
ncbi:transposase [Clostridioides sp. ES-S-0054-01]|uniref:transposase n=1 Tax=unclassified Clostridioides TaxID=2635829 RepID=UPI001D6044EC|nr:transposase [Clostridioides sp. ES-S-0171-01]MCC0689745.1 transposase [Clostridioides sp. ES-S-0056-01]MCC0715105.1 transposase [Clostridioides sp. ES-S-0077-01]UDN56438.1 transposase [Clostridioides sp. ES-S-0054-01]